MSTKLLSGFHPLNQVTKLALQTVDTAKYERRCQDPPRGTTRTKGYYIKMRLGQNFNVHSESYYSDKSLNQELNVEASYIKFPASC